MRRRQIDPETKLAQFRRGSEARGPRRISAAGRLPAIDFSRILLYS